VLNNANRCKFGFTNTSNFIDGAGFKNSLSGSCRHGAYFFPLVNRRTRMGAENNVRNVERDRTMSYNMKISFVDVSFSSRMPSPTHQVMSSQSYSYCFTPLSILTKGRSFGANTKLSPTMILPFVSTPNVYPTKQAIIARSRYSSQQLHCHCHPLKTAYR
jgi:hypothetical protein